MQWLKWSEVDIDDPSWRWEHPAGFMYRVYASFITATTRWESSVFDDFMLGLSRWYPYGGGLLGSVPDLVGWWLGEFHESWWLLLWLGKDQGQTGSWWSGMKPGCPWWFAMDLSGTFRDRFIIALWDEVSAKGLSSRRCELHSQRCPHDRPRILWRKHVVMSYWQQVAKMSA